MSIKKNLPLLIGLCIPLAMIIFVAVSVYVPGLLVTPQYNFLYVTGDAHYYDDQQHFTVERNKLVKHPEVLRPQITLYLHDVTKNKSREISPEEARTLTLDSSVTSPDGFDVVRETCDRGLFLFAFGSDCQYNDLYLQGHNASKKLNIQTGGYSSYGDFRFLGWVM